MPESGCWIDGLRQAADYFFLTRVPLEPREPLEPRPALEAPDVARGADRGAELPEDTALGEPLLPVVLLIRLVVDRMRPDELVALPEETERMARALVLTRPDELPAVAEVL
jgi:hypothetical protein